MDKKVLKNYLTILVSRVIRDDFFGMASEMSYMIALGIFPFITFIATIFGWLGKQNLIEKLIIFFQNFIPGDVVDLTKKVLEEVTLFGQDELLATVGLIVTIALASNAIAVIIKGLNRAYDVVDNRSFLHTRFLSVLMVFANALFTFICMNLVIFGKVILNYIFQYSIIELHWIRFISIIRWPIAFLALYIMAGLNYYILPAVTGPEKVRRKSTTYGTLFFCTFWLLGSTIFSVYINHMNTYNRVYGTLGAFAILLVWLYYTSLIILIGGEINSTTYRRLLAQSMDSQDS